MALNRKQLWKRLMLTLIALPILLFTTAVLIISFKQQEIVNEALSQVNNDFKGKLVIQGSHISPFANFPYVSIDLEDVKVYEAKDADSEPILHISDAYIGFDLLQIISGNVEVKTIRVEDGFLKLIQHTDGSFNVVNALSFSDDYQEPENNNASLPISLKKIEVVDIDLIKINEANDIVVDAYLDKVVSSCITKDSSLEISLDTEFKLSVISAGDTTFIKKKPIAIDTELRYLENQNLLEISPSEIGFGIASLNMEGSVDIDDDMNLNLLFNGNKPNFDLFLAFAPEELKPTLKNYDNGGKIFFRASIKGKSINGNNPLINAEFGCEDAFFNNRLSNKKLDDLYFKGSFSNGELRNASTMEFSMEQFSAKPEAGNFSGKLKVKNFNSPEIDLQLLSNFDLEFLSDFLNIQNLQDLDGEVALTMNFHDIIDLENPERSLERLNDSYFTELEVKNLSFKSPDFHLPVDQIDIKATMDGNEARIDNFFIKIGNSDLRISADVSDLPAIIHHTDIPVLAHLKIESSFLDLKQLTLKDTISATNEQIENLRMNFTFNSSARAFTESPNLPVGDFYIEDLYAKFTHYPHELHDFHSKIHIDTVDFRLIDFRGIIDSSDFHFSGVLKNYDLWFEEKPVGDTKIEFDLDSDLLQLEDLFSYRGENFVPEDYRHEKFKKLKIHGYTDIHFRDGLESIDLMLDRVEANMEVHPMRLENFNGRIHYEKGNLTVEELSGQMGRSDFTLSINYFLGTDSLQRATKNSIKLRSKQLDFDELFAYNPPPAAAQSTTVNHDSAWNIFEVPFSDMNFALDIAKLNYHRILIDDFHLKGRMQEDHYLFVDSMSMGIADGQMGLKGYLNGSDPKRIYFSPNMKLEKVRLDKLFFKFENFGQDHLVSDNISGTLTGNMSGKIRMYPDLTPKLEESDLHMDVQVLDGQLLKYAAFEAMADYFKDKNLDKVRFDTLNNSLDIKNGIVSIPNMNINTSLGFFEISGKQNIDLSMEYYLRVPWRVVTGAGANKLFGKKKEVSEEQVDEIQIRDEDKRVRFLNLKITGTPEDYNISLGRND